jgi:hypothetical protein
LSWLFIQRTGGLRFNGVPFAVGYSGNGLGKNNPDMQAAVGVGPIPAGRWRIVGEPFNSDANGPFCLRLEPNIGTDTLGRSGFLIHGDSIRKPGTASRGCVILSRPVRGAIWESGDTDFVVVAEEPQSSGVDGLMA